MRKKVLYRIDRGDDSITLQDVLDKIQELQKENPDMEVFFDGHEYAVCSRPKRKST